MADDTKGWTLVEETAPVAVVARPDTTTGIKIAAAGGSVPLAARAAMEVATHPGVARAGSTVGQVVGGIEGALHGGPMGAAGGVWTGGKAGWFTGKLAQRMAAPVATALEKVAPYAQTLSTLGGAAGVGDLAQIVEPKRTDIGFLGLSANGGPIDSTHPPLMNEAIAKIAERMGRPDIADLWRGKKAQ
jgi:hypothetical protein